MSQRNATLIDKIEIEIEIINFNSDDEVLAFPQTHMLTFATAAISAVTVSLCNGFNWKF